MGNDKFWLNSNNNRFFELNDLKGLKPEDIAQNPEFAKLLQIFDTNGNSNLEITELETIFSQLKAAAGSDSILSNEELSLLFSEKGLEEKLEPSQEDIDAQYQEYADMYKMELDKVKAAIPEVELIKDLKVKKASEFIKENAKITEE